MPSTPKHSRSRSARRIVVALLARPGFQRRQDLVVEDFGAAVAPVLPRKEAVPGLEARAARNGAALSEHAGEREIADRHHMRIGVAGARMASAIAECVELLDIGDVERGLRLPPRRAGPFRGCGARADRTDRMAGRRDCPSVSPSATSTCGSSSFTATIAVVSPISIGVSSMPSLEIEPERTPS